MSIAFKLFKFSTMYVHMFVLSLCVSLCVGYIRIMLDFCTSFAKVPRKICNEVSGNDP